MELRLQANKALRLIVVSVILASLIVIPNVQAGDGSGVKVNGMIQIWGQSSSDGNVPNSLFLKRSELKLSGSIIENLVGYEFLMDPASVPGAMTQDLIIYIQPSPLLRVSVGQMKYPLTREGLEPSSQLDFIDRAMIAAREFGDRRDIGFMVSGKANIFDYSVGLFNGSGANNIDLNDAKDFGARLVVNPFGNLSIGASTYSGSNNHLVSDTADVDRGRLGGDLQYSVSALTVKAEYMLGNDDGLEGQGYYAGVTYLVNPKLKLATRYDVWDSDTDLDDNEESMITIGSDYSLKGDAAKVMVNYIIHNDKGTDTKTNDMLIQFQVEF